MSVNLLSRAEGASEVTEEPEEVEVKAEILSARDIVIVDLGIW